MVVVKMLPSFASRTSQVSSQSYRDYCALRTCSAAKLRFTRLIICTLKSLNKCKFAQFIPKNTYTCGTGQTRRNILYLFLNCLLLTFPPDIWRIDQIGHFLHWIFGSAIHQRNVINHAVVNNFFNTLPFISCIATIELQLCENCTGAVSAKLRF